MRETSPDEQRPWQARPNAVILPIEEIYDVSRLPFDRRPGLSDEPTELRTLALASVYFANSWIACIVAGKPVNPGMRVVVDDPHYNVKHFNCRSTLHPIDKRKPTDPKV